MGVRIKPCTVGLVSIVVICILISVGIATYHWKNKIHQIYQHEGRSSELTIYNDEENDYNNTYDGKSNFEWVRNIRLDPNVIPIHYKLHIHPETHLGLFNGHVSIILNVTKEINHIRIHSKDLEITSRNLTSLGNESIQIQEMLFYKPNEFIIFRTTDGLLPGMYNLSIDFNGNLTRGIIGLYRSSYLDPTTNRTRYVIGSKFQPTYARRAFPCFDEPGFKSTYTISLVKPTELIALSNMPIENEDIDTPTTGFNTVHFKKSVPMVTYLIAFAVGDFDYKVSNTKHGVPVRVFATRFQVDKTEYAIKIAPKILEFYEDYFNIKYPLPKLDIIGIPDFVSGAMEHWGLISFRESNLLYHNGVSSAYNKQRIASVIAHEIAHMWFGNLMTLKWWSDLWLNEGFASYCEYKGINSVHPNWEIETQFLSQDLTPVLVLDGKLSSHPIIQKVEHPDQITEIFDTISYNKGASVIRMLEYYMGHIKFQSGISNFLRKFSYKNADTNDLWDGLENELTTHKNISLLMDTWTKQMGYPILITQIINNSLLITQERYMENQKQIYNKNESIFGYRWEIPLELYINNRYYSILIHHTQESVNIPLNDSMTGDIKLNIGNSGYYRIKYPTESYKQILNNFNSNFKPIERCGFLDDLFSLSYSQYISYEIALDFGLKLRNENHLVPWDCVDNHIFTLSNLLENSAPETYSLFRKYIINITSPLYAKYNWTDSENENHLDRLLKVKIFSLCCSHGHRNCLEETNKLFLDWINKGVNIPPGLRPIVYKWGMWQANEDIWDKVWNKYILETDSQERVRLISSLAFTQHSWLIRKFIGLASNDTYIKRQDYFTAMRYISMNPIGNSILWTHYRNEYSNLVKRFTMNDRYFGKMILDITSDYSSPVKLNEVLNFIELNPNAGAGQRARLTAIETIKNNIEWANRNTLTIHNWLKN